MSKQTASVSHGRCAARHDARFYIPSNVHEEMLEENVHLVYQPVKEAFQEVFGDALSEYNSKQKRKDRMKSDYYKEVVDGQYKTDENGKKKRIMNAPHPEYEYVFQFGNQDTNPASIINEEGKRVLGPYADLSREALIEYFHKFKEKNPNLYITGASIHLDEATPHLHIRFIPIAEGYKQGMKKRCSLSKALDNMGYERGSKRGKDLSILRWVEKQTELLKEVGEAKGIENIEGHSKGRHHYENHEWCSGIGDEITALERKAAKAKEEADFYKKLANDEEKAAENVHNKRIEVQSQLNDLHKKIEDVKNSMETTLKNKEEYEKEIYKLNSPDGFFNQFRIAINNFIKVLKESNKKRDIFNAALDLLKPFTEIYNVFKETIGFENKNNMPIDERKSPEIQKGLDDIILSASARSEETLISSSDRKKENNINLD